MLFQIGSAKMLIRLGIMFLLLKCIKSLRFGNFSKTDIIVNNCDETKLIKTIIKPRLLFCMMACTEEAECRRLLFCSTDKSCKLFQDGIDCIMKTNSNAGCSCYRKTIGCGEDNNCTCPLGYYGDNCQDVITDCSDGFNKGIVYTIELLTTIQPVSSPEPFEVLCLLAWGGFTSILMRAEYCNFEDFNRTLVEYETGFGAVYLNRWIGFNRILAILNNPHSSFTLAVQILDVNWASCENRYTNFQIGSKTDNYVLDLTTDVNSQSCGDSITGTPDLNGKPFSTFDVDFTGTHKCAINHGGGWWFDASSECARSFLTGTIEYGGSSGVYYFWKDNWDGRHIMRIGVKLLRYN